MLFLRCCLAYFFGDRVLHLAWSIPSRTGWLPATQPANPRDPLAPILLMLGLYAHPIMPSSFYLNFGSRLSCLLSKHFNDWAISRLPSCCPVFIIHQMFIGSNKKTDGPLASIFSKHSFQGFLQRYLSNCYHNSCIRSISSNKPLGSWSLRFLV